MCHGHFEESTLDLKGIAHHLCLLKKKSSNNNCLYYIFVIVLYLMAFCGGTCGGLAKANFQLAFDVYS